VVREGLLHDGTVELYRARARARDRDGVSGVGSNQVWIQFSKTGGHWQSGTGTGDLDGCPSFADCWSCTRYPVLRTHSSQQGPGSGSGAGAGALSSLAGASRVALPMLRPVLIPNGNGPVFFLSPSPSDPRFSYSFGQVPPAVGPRQYRFGPLLADVYGVDPRRHTCRPDFTGAVLSKLPVRVRLIVPNVDDQRLGDALEAWASNGAGGTGEDLLMLLWW